MSGAAQTAAVFQPQDTWSLSPEQRAASAAPEAFVAEFAIDGAVDERTLRAALAEVAARHDVLSSAFVAAPGFRGLRRAPLDAPAAAAWTVRDLRGRPDPETEIADDVAALTTAPFDLARGETLRAGLWRLGDEAWRLALVASPLAADRTTLALIAEALQGRGASSHDDGTYAQYADWRAEMESDEEAPQARLYWRDQSADALPAPKLAFRQTGDGGAREERRVAVDPALAARFAEISGEAGLELGLLAVWTALLGRISGEDRFRLGWRRDCRRDYEMFSGVAGPFEKVMPVRASYDATEPFGRRLASLIEATASHLDWQEHLALDGPDAPQGLIVGFGLDAARDGWRRLSLDGPSPFELELRPEIDASGAMSALAIGWDGGGYGADAAETLLDQAAALLAAIVARPDAPLGEQPIVGPRERARMAALDRTAVAPAGRAPLLPLILGWAEWTPDAPALSSRGVTLSYAELGRRVDGIAQSLAARGVGPETVVALDMARSPDMVTALLAVWRAGGVYLPLDPDWPEARRRQLTEAAGAALVLHDGAPAAGAATLAFADALAGTEAAALPDLDAPADRAAYVLFTSGSTGTPKGVVVEHGQLANYVAAVREALGLDRSRSFALASTVAADLGNTTLFGALAGGARLAVADDHEARDPAAFAAFLKEHAIDCAKLAPSHLSALLEAEDAGVPETLILGGEAVSAGLLARIRAVDPACRIFNHYGPTETTVGVLVHEAAPSDVGPLPLTCALDGDVALVLDAHGRPAPTGALGELHIGGAQLCRGYLGADSAGFVDDPTSPGRKLYPTGDLARYRPEGGLEIAGRADQQAKIAGHRVEAGEVEAALAALDFVREAAVIVRRDEAGVASLVAFAAADGVDAAALKAALAARLPAPMVPARIVVLDRMPLLGNGKIDRAALGQRPLDEAPAGVAPRDALETVLRDLAAELLGRSEEAVGVTDDFFDLGGNSLQVIKFVARIRKLFGVDLAPGAVFDHPSVAELAAALRAEAPDGRIDQVAEMRARLAGLSEEERAALLAEADRAAS
ncbi:MAG: non-ribosomal peptide synthetase [Ancylobacter novellus]|uniref:Non-ribosomal peptide synthetase n=1 Tax=Ancylobacter novellus TaxID=921 RepID=A0A2W5M6D2_ANCNO|nr:MAG: non-ribosomal peptide synthetase [Ancylobacter novellus]